ncbi:polysaccharide deacetylase family protein [Phenylobacterium sp.]|jgi:peptidoglycan/xylan/chitin deacetylase (PgdA/CDA1 family)|uniref:oligosaccharide deacetylase HfsH n=1 Tax=Phenylobacterium sp. TaxID=1871053 RepID=UPI002E37B28D|nr:polysaccharide deacetylase family protein [Phenylobacterium sp.]HEX2561560.1 polysaccharide deacetylase family protein [Phenylobacterium sp.]
MQAYQADTSLLAKLRRRMVRGASRRRAVGSPGRPMVSFTFDDAPVSAARRGAELLEARGLKGAYYVSAGLAGTEGPMGRYADADDYRRLAAAGHEIGCHTYSHLDCGRAAGPAALAEAVRNAEQLEAWDIPFPATFAYPYGDVAAGPKAILAARFRLLRALHPGLVEKGCDLNQAPAVGIEGAEGEATARRWLDKAKARKAWLILYTHDVQDSPSQWGCTPAALAGLIDAAVEGGLEVVTVAEGARRLAG